MSTTESMSVSGNASGNATAIASVSGLQMRMGTVTRRCWRHGFQPRSRTVRVHVLELSDDVQAHLRVRVHVHVHVSQA